MSEPLEIVTRPTRTASWTLVRGGAAVAPGYAVCRPDRRWFVSVDASSQEDHGPLVAGIVSDLGQDLHTRIEARTQERWNCGAASASSPTGLSSSSCSLNDPAESHDQTFDESQFDPSTYLVQDISAAQTGAALVLRRRW